MAESPLFDIAAMEDRLAALDAERTYLLGLITAARAYEATVGRVIFASQSGRIVMRQGVGKSQRAAPIMQATEDLASELMEKAGGPISTSALVDAMRARGVPVPEKNPTNVVSARMSNSTKFEGRRGIGWWFAGRPWPEDPLIPFESEDPGTDPPRDDTHSNTAADQ